jgi:hypothetical protein
MIGRPGLAHLPFKGTKRGLVALLLFDLELAKTLDDGALSYDRDTVERNLSNRKTMVPNHHTSPPDSQR